MRLVQVAKALGMTGQQLRKELATVDFGVKLTDREVPDILAQGIVRYLSQKNGITVDLSVLGAVIEQVQEGEEKVEALAHQELHSAERSERVLEAPRGSPSFAKATEGRPSVRKRVVEGTQKGEGEVPRSVPILRKLTLEDVSKEAIARQRRELGPLTKKEREERVQEEKAMLRPQERQEKKGVDVQEQIKEKIGMIMLPEHISVKEFAEKTGVQVPRVIEALLRNGVMATITQFIDYETAAIVAADLGCTVQKEISTAKVEDLLSRNLSELLRDEPEKLQPRPPVVVVMGHVDHGKTSILDAIRSSDIASKEAGGITQHIGAYQVEVGPTFAPGGATAGKGQRTITFLDTPGHEAFTAMRARGAKVTDIAVIVVAADEGVRETTVEAIDHAKDAQVPVLVAINKIDKGTEHLDRIKGELASHGLTPEDWSGSTPVVLCSAVTKQGIPELLEHILLLADLHDFKANPDRPAVATVIESHLDPALGPVVTVIVNTGTLHVGDAFVCGKTVGRVRAMMNARGERLMEVLPSWAVRVAGSENIPQVGDILQVVSSERDARDMLRAFLVREGEQTKRSFVDFVSRLSEGKLTQLKVILKADAQGSLEAIESALSQCGTAEVSVKILHGGIGAVTESDVMLAAASQSVILAFRVPVSVHLRRASREQGVEVREYQVIYALFEDIGNIAKGLLEPEESEKVLGHLEVKGVFFRKKGEQIIGGRVLDGTLKRGFFRLQRAGNALGVGKITSLKHVDKDVKEAKEGSECGMKVECDVSVEERDVLEVYVKEKRKK